MSPREAIKVLIVDDSIVVRRFLTMELGREPDIMVVGSAEDPYQAREMIVERKPEIVLLDIEMPRMDGLTFLQKLMKHYPIPVIIISSLTRKNEALALRALSLGAADVIPKAADKQGAKDMIELLKAAIRQLHKHDPSKVRLDASRPKPAHAAHRPIHLRTDKMVAIGASTGGTNVIEFLLRAMPNNGPPTVIVQHMPAGFTAAFANRLNTLSEMTVREAAQGDVLEHGLALVAPGDRHMQIKREGAKCYVDIVQTPKVNGHRPSVDVTFHSLAQHMGKKVLGIILTGMGGDGAAGMLAMKKAGAQTIAQNEASCVVFGMPKVAISMGGVDDILSPDEIAQRILEISLQENLLGANSTASQMSGVL